MHQLQDKVLIAELSAVGDMTHSSNMTEGQTTLSISQLIPFNTSERRHDNGMTGALNYHSRDREAPLPIY